MPTTNSNNPAKPNVSNGPDTTNWAIYFSPNILVKPNLEEKGIFGPHSNVSRPIHKREQPKWMKDFI